VGAGEASSIVLVFIFLSPFCSFFQIARSADPDGKKELILCLLLYFPRRSSWVSSLSKCAMLFSCSNFFPPFKDPPPLGFFFFSFTYPFLEPVPFGCDRRNPGKEFHLSNPLGRWFCRAASFFSSFFVKFLVAPPSISGASALGKILSSFFFLQDFKKNPAMSPLPWSSRVQQICGNPPLQVVFLHFWL